MCWRWDLTDWFVPEADALDQQRETAPVWVVPGDQEENRAGGPALDYPQRMPIEAPEADVVEQTQTVDSDDDDEY